MFGAAASHLGGHGINGDLMCATNAASPSYMLQHTGKTSTLRDSWQHATTGELTTNDVVEDGTYFYVTCSAQDDIEGYLITDPATILFDIVAPDTNMAGITLNGDSFISCGSTDDEFYFHTGKTTTIASSYAVVGSTSPGGCSFRAGNLYEVNYSTDKAYRHVGVTATIDAEIAMPDTLPAGIEHCEQTGDLWSSDYTADEINEHSGFTTTISTTWTTAQVEPRGLHIIG